MKRRRRPHDSASFREADLKKTMIFEEPVTPTTLFSNVFCSCLMKLWCSGWVFIHFQWKSGTHGAHYTPTTKKIIVVLIENVVPSVSRLKKTEHKCSQGKDGILNLDGPGLAKKYFISSETSILHFWGVYSTKSRFNSSILHHFARRNQ